MATEQSVSGRTPKPPNIYVVGAQSTGKTTLVSALDTYFEQHRTYLSEQVARPHIIKEVARSVLRDHHFTADDITTSKPRALQLQRLILNAQSKAERSFGQEWYITDRSGLDPLAYAHRYVGDEEARQLRQEEAWQDVEKRIRKGLVVMCGVGGEWLVDDGIRLMPESRDDWAEFQSLFCSLMDELGIEYTILPSSVRDLGSRVDFVIEQWQNR